MKYDDVRKNIGRFSEFRFLHLIHGGSSDPNINIISEVKHDIKCRH